MNLFRKGYSREEQSSRGTKKKSRETNKCQDITAELKYQTYKNKQPHDKTNKTDVRPEKIRSGHTSRLLRESLLCTQWVAKDLRFLHTESEEFDQTAWISRLIWAFAGGTSYCRFYCAITKTRLYKFDALQPHFYIENLGFTGVYFIFLISAQKYRLWVLWKISEFLSEFFLFFWW